LKNDPVKSFSQRDFTEVQKEFEPYFRKMDVAIPHDFSTRTKNFEHQVEALLKAAPPVASFIFGTPSKEVIQELKKRNIVTLAVATNVEEALAIEEAKVDIVVASGKEAGGHRAAFIEGSKHALLSTKSLVEKVKAQSKLPIIAAGGISTGNDICEMLRLGAGATQLGTAFLATQESNASQEHKNRLLSDKAYETRLTKVFTGRLARVISTDFVEETKEIKNLAPYPIQSSFLSALRKAGIEHDKTAFEAFWSGQPTTKLVFTTAESLFNSLVEEIETRLSL
jgi:nitronate monooxygenase